MAYNGDKTLAYVAVMTLLAKRFLQVYNEPKIMVQYGESYGDGDTYYLRIDGYLTFSKYVKYGEEKPTAGEIGCIDEDVLTKMFDEFLDKCKKWNSTIPGTLCMYPEDFEDMMLLNDIIHTVGPVFHEYLGKPYTYAELLNKDRSPGLVVISHHENKTKSYCIGNVENLKGLMYKIEEVVKQYLGDGVCPCIVRPNESGWSSFDSGVIPYITDVLPCITDITSDAIGKKIPGNNAIHIPKGGLKPDHDWRGVKLKNNTGFSPSDLDDDTEEHMLKD